MSNINTTKKAVIASITVLTVLALGPILNSQKASALDEGNRIYYLGYFDDHYNDGYFDDHYNDGYFDDHYNDGYFDNHFFDRFFDNHFFDDY